jgi:hypothetical protein
MAPQHAIMGHEMANDANTKKLLLIVERIIGEAIARVPSICRGVASPARMWLIMKPSKFLLTG